MDLMQGQVVRGEGGRRDEYRPIRSCLTDSSKPLAVAEAFRRTFGFTELYLADLDAILGAKPAWEEYALLREHGFRLWLDAGVRRLADAKRLADAGIETIVLGLETLRGSKEFVRILETLGPQRIVFSLDMKGGKPLTGRRAWPANNAVELAQWVIDKGAKRLLLLDLAHVGGYGGPGTESLCAALAKSDPQVEISTGGGIRDMAALRRMQELGVANLLVASALHDGLITAEELRVC
jgi:phosphoribosylformimino-5-aminoimidazole carboxamide ribotide isomerase